jgi:hypothetical protein
MMADRQSTLAPRFGPAGASSSGPTSNPTIARSLNAASAFERSSFHYDERCADKEAELSTSCPSEDKLRRFGAVRVDFRELQGFCGVSVGEPPVVPPKCSISG